MKIINIEISILIFVSIIFFVFSDEQLFMDQASHKKSRNLLKKEYERCKQKLHSDLPPGNKIENFDVSGLRHRSRFSSIDSGEDSQPKSKVFRWPHGVVPVQIERGFTRAEKSSLKCAILFFRAHTCLTFVTKNNTHEDYLYLMKTHKNGGCFIDVIGKKGGRQILNLDSSNDHCWEHGTIIHEVMHVLGFFHEHSRSDRNKYLVIHWDNIPKSLYFQYWTTADMGYEHKDVGKYDYGSVMHYSRYLGFDLALSAKLHNDQYEKQAKDNDAMGQRIEPSDEDTNKLNLLYCPHLVVQAIPDCKDDIDCAGFKALCLNTEVVRKKCRSTCNLCAITATPTTTTTPTTKSTSTTTTISSTSTRRSCINTMEQCMRKNSPECISMETAHLDELLAIVNKSTTVNGTKCDNWSVHGWSTVGDHNFCRNPENGAGPWRFTVDENRQWNYCYPPCPSATAVISSTSATSTMATTTIQGCINTKQQCVRENTPECKSMETAHIDELLTPVNKSTTVNGIECSNWMKHGWSSVGDHNFCRNPEGVGPWCFTMDENVQWEYCYPPCTTGT